MQNRTARENAQPGDFSHLLPILAGVIAFVAFMVPGTTQAFFEDLYVSGFVSQGYYKTSEHNHIISNSTKGSSEFNEAGISVQANPVERLRIGIQLISIDAGDVGNNGVRLDWAFGDYHWRDWLGFRAGKIKMQMGLYNIGRDIDMLRTPVFLPQSTYSEGWRDFALAQEGFNLYGSLDFGAVGSFEYEANAGALNVPDPEESYWRKMISSNIEFSLDVYNQQYSGDTLFYRYQQTDRISPEFPWLAGGHLVWNTPVNGLRLATSLTTGEYTMKSKVVVYEDRYDSDTGKQLSHELQYLDDIWSARYLLTMFSLEYSVYDFILASEILIFEQDNQTNQGAYLMLTWEPGTLYSISGYVSEFIPDTKNRDGSKFIDPIREDWAAWQREAVVAARVNLTSHWLVKAEFHAVDGVGQLLYTPELGDSSSRYWTQFAVKTTFHF